MRQSENFERGKAYLRTVREAGSGEIFPTVNLRRAFTDVGASVCENDSGNGLEIAYGSHKAYVPFVSKSKREQVDPKWCYKPAGLPMFNIFSAMFN